MKAGLVTSYTPATRPTLYFIGVTTTKSSIMRVFPRWAERLGIGDAEIRGIDFPLHADPASYRGAVEFIASDPLSLGALVTTHKIDLFKACRDLFDEVDPLAALMEETSCISKQGGRLVCHAKDPITSGLALDGFLPDGHFACTGAEFLVLGAGGSAIAMTWHLMQPRRSADRPSRIIVADVNAPRLAEIRRVHEEMSATVPVDYHLVRSAAENDTIVSGLKPGSVVVNATGLGKDAPGSPLTDGARFPEHGIVWELNYRGDLVFLAQARAQAAARALTIVDGWTYFIFGWTQVIGEVFHVPVPTAGPGLDALSAVAAEA
jgi:shikimate 5-dehydrogenase